MAHDIDHEHSRQHQDSYRVRVDIPLRMTPIDESEIAERSTGILSRVDASFPDIEPALVAWLDRIERKLDHLIAQQGPPDSRGIGIDDYKSLDLSANGFRIASTDASPVGKAMYIEFELPSVPVLLVRCIGRIEATNPHSEDTGKNCIDVVFETIRQADVDAVVRYTLTVQRQAIRGHNSPKGRQT